MQTVCADNYFCHFFVWDLKDDGVSLLSPSASLKAAAISAKIRFLPKVNVDLSKAHGCTLQSAWSMCAPSPGRFYMEEWWQSATSASIQPCCKHWKLLSANGTCMCLYQQRTLWIMSYWKALRPKWPLHYATSWLCLFDVFISVTEH